MRRYSKRTSVPVRTRKPARLYLDERCLYNCHTSYGKSLRLPLLRDVARDGDAVTL